MSMQLNKALVRAPSDNFGNSAKCVSIYNFIVNLNAGSVGGHADAGKGKARD